MNGRNGEGFDALIDDIDEETLRRLQEEEPPWQEAQLHAFQPNTMGLIASDSGGGDFKKVPTGSHVARCVRVVDMGTQYSEYQGEASWKHEVNLSFEIPEERITIEGQDLPTMISKNYTMSLHENANLRRDLDSWRGEAFTEEELKGFPIVKVLGAVAMINVVHNAGKNGKVWANIASVSPIPKQLKAVPAETELLSYEIENGEDETFQKLPKWQREKIQKSREFQDGGDAVVTTEDAAVDDLPF